MRCAWLLLIVLTAAAPAQAAEKQIGNPCSGDQNAADWDTIARCVGGTYQRSPYFFGATTDTCDSAIAGLARYNSGTLQLCDGVSWQNLGVSSCDNAPAFFAFIDQNSLGTASVYMSNIVAVTGMESGCGAVVAVSGQGAPEYRVCSTANCSSIDIAWTAANNTVAMQGKYLQLRATTSASAGTTHTVTASIGPVSSDWKITTTPTDCSTGAIGTVCADGSVYAGITPDGSVPMYVTRCDYNMTWNGAACINSRIPATWSSGGYGPTVNTPIVNCGSVPACPPSGKANTAILVATDASSEPEFQIHAAAKACDDLVAHGQTDWYLPSAPELGVVYTNKDAIGNFLTDGARYNTSSERDMDGAWHQGFSNGAYVYGFKNAAVAIRCARQ